MNVRKQMIWWGLPLLFLACEETINWELDAGQNGHLVVEAVLTDEDRVQQLRLSLSYDQLNGLAPPVTNATVSVEVNGISLPFFPDQEEPGLYKSEQPFAVIDDLEYRLIIEWEGQMYTATSVLADVAPLPAITFRDFGKADSLTFAEFAPVYHPDQQAMYEMQVDWSQLSNDPADRALLYFYTFSSVEVSSLARPVRDTVFFPRGSVVVARKFGLNDEYADYLRALVVETDWRGGVFYSAAASLPTNLTNGALGFFSTCAVDADTLIAE